MSCTKLQVHIYSCKISQSSFSPQKTFSRKVTEVEKDVLHCKTVQSILNEKKGLYNLRRKGTFHNICQFQKFAIDRCIVFCLHDIYLNYKK